MNLLSYRQSRLCDFLIVSFKLDYRRQTTRFPSQPESRIIYCMRTADRRGGILTPG